MSADGDAAGGTDADATAAESTSATAQGARDVDEHPLVVENLRKTFGGITAVDDASFSVAEGSLTGLIGPNGAGKSTTFNCITGVHTPTSGRVTFQGTDITGMAPHAIAQQGLVRTFQIARELPEMTVLENMMLAPNGQVGERLTNAVVPGLRDRVVEQEKELLERAWQQLEFFEIDHLAQEYAGTLSGGQRKLLEMARALMTDPEMVLLDEPLAGVNPTLEEKLLDRIHELRDRGNTFLFVEHDMDVIMNNCEHVIVMHQGSVLAEGTPEQITSDERVVEAYLGGDV
ncbi:ABC transporter ATP-binding protein [Halobaculum halobium]|uniref:Probable branched-chain amino acid transport ATP-binding protein LivG n=1 Tax=Halobaculum halobium TaxID=3032281 RepID=A0ABD5TF56_9EURY|nr:ABC transporter ATP-binding protein [Halobaculum sp. SYNS20]